MFSRSFAGLAVLAAAMVGSTAAGAADLIIEQPELPVVADAPAGWDGLYFGAAIGGF